MSLLETLTQRSLFSEASLLQDREGYAPLPWELTPPLAYAYWTQRATVQSELGLARELAGLPNVTLADLAEVFERTPRRRRFDSARFAIPVGVGMLFVGALAWMLFAALPLAGTAAGSVVQSVGIGALAAGLLAVAVGALAAFNMMPLDVAHGRLGLVVGLLNEQHPWLYKAARLAQTPAAEAYRQRVLNERGALRGVDHLMMREIVRGYEALELTQLSRNVVEELQRVAVLPEPSAPRLVAVPAGDAGALSAAR
ncbi:MAG: hypothetical protein ABIX46_14380 [Burkholderiaceae bacterium]